MLLLHSEQANWWSSFAVRFAERELEPADLLGVCKSNVRAPGYSTDCHLHNSFVPLVSHNKN